MSEASLAKTRGEQGFVLLEVIVTVAMIAVLVSLVTAYIGFGVRLMSAGRAQDDRTRIVRASETLNVWFASAMPVRNRDRTRRTVLFEGQRDALAFVSLWTGMGQPEGATVVTIRHLAAREGPGALGFSLSLLDAGADVLPDLPARDMLLKPVRGARFSYFGSRDGRERPAWFESWSDSMLLPRLVSVKLEVQIGSHLETMDLVYRLNAR